MIEAILYERRVAVCASIAFGKCLYVFKCVYAAAYKRCMYVDTVDGLFVTATAAVLDGSVCM